MGWDQKSFSLVWRWHTVLVRTQRPLVPNFMSVVGLVENFSPWLRSSHGRRYIEWPKKRWRVLWRCPSKLGFARLQLAYGRNLQLLFLNYFNHHYHEQMNWTIDPLHLQSSLYLLFVLPIYLLPSELYSTFYVESIITSSEVKDATVLYKQVLFPKYWVFPILCECVH